MKNPYQMVGKRIRFFREQDGITQADLAEKVGLSNNYIGLIERGVKHAKLDALSKIAQALEVKLFDLFTPLNNTIDDDTALKELNDLLKRRNSKDAKLLLSIYKSICEHSPKK